jgi:hypothetical protein
VELDYAQIVKHVLRPARPGLAAARAAVKRIREPGAAWEALAVQGVIPAAWVHEQRRSFEHAGRQSDRHPPSVRACVALACDPTGVSRVETFALEFAARLAMCGAGTASRLRWRVGSLTHHDLHVRAPLEPIAVLHRMLLGVHEDADTTDWSGGEPAWVIHPDVPRRRWPEPGDFTDSAAFGRIQREKSASELWHSAALNGYRFDGMTRPVADLPNPFEPSFEIWRLGYAIDALIADTLVLLAPEVGSC